MSQPSKSIAHKCVFIRSHFFKFFHEFDDSTGSAITRRPHKLSGSSILAPAFWFGYQRPHQRDTVTDGRDGGPFGPQRPFGPAFVFAANVSNLCLASDFSGTYVRLATLIACACAYLHACSGSKTFSHALAGWVFGRPTQARRQMFKTRVLGTFW